VRDARLGQPAFDHVQFLPVHQHIFFFGRFDPTTSDGVDDDDLCPVLCSSMGDRFIRP
jgi:hypothetical protein